MRGRIYTRKSRALGDPDDPELMAHHKSALLRLAAARGITVAPEDVISEVGSGETIAARPGFAALLAEYEAGLPGQEALFVTEVERLSRGSMVETGRVMEALSRAGVLLITPGRDYNLANADDELWYGLTAALGRRELNKYKERKRAKLDELTLAGRCLSGIPPFGYVWDPKLKQPVPDPATFPVLQAWCREILTDSTRVLAARHDTSVRLVCATLRNPIICGYPARRTALHNGRKNWAAREMRLPREEWTWPERPGDYEPACSLAEWQAIQAVLDARTCSRSATWTTDGWCRALVRFHAAPIVGEPLPGWVGLSARHYKNHAPTPTYQLRQRDATASRSIRSLCFVPRALVHTAATDAFRRLLLRPARFAEKWAGWQAAWALRASQPRQREEEITARLAAARREIDGIVVREGKAEDPEHRASLGRYREALQREIATLKREAGQLALAAEPPSTLPVDPAKFALLFGRFDQGWEASTDSDKALYANLLLTGIHVYVYSYQSCKVAVREVIGWDYADWLGEEPVRL